MVALILHTGVGSRVIKKDKEKLRQDLIDKASKTGFHMLREGKDALDVVEKIINIMESSGLFNAGIGSVIQSDGGQRMDAGIMSSDLRCGAVAGVSGIKLPISIARKLMDMTNIICLIGDYAKEFGIKHEISEKNSHSNNQSKTNQSVSNTVGAVILDQNGKLAAGTSTGGLFKALSGRIGDCSMIGAGIYANEIGGVSCTGIGEDIIRTTLARHTVFQLEQGFSAQEAANRAINYFKEKTQSVAGVIVLTIDGEYGISHNGKYMNWKYLRD
ncbi:MAG: isoaspartyl peptidase/L-asparaginase [Candidatus Helarchaeota archaeon]|nr:isoaspartyl peptidase/L-asparaginase [Candidatus Helarchaeota archaeon]